MQSLNEIEIFALMNIILNKTLIHEKKHVILIKSVMIKNMPTISNCLLA